MTDKIQTRIDILKNTKAPRLFFDELTLEVNKYLDRQKLTEASKNDDLVGNSGQAEMAGSRGKQKSADTTMIQDKQPAKGTVAKMQIQDADREKTKRNNQPLSPAEIAKKHGISEEEFRAQARKQADECLGVSSSTPQEMQEYAIKTAGKHAKRNGMPSPFPLEEIYYWATDDTTEPTGVYDHDDIEYLERLSNEACGKVHLYLLSFFEPGRPLNKEQLEFATDVAREIRMAYRHELPNIPLAKNPDYPTKNDFIQLEQWFLNAHTAISINIVDASLVTTAQIASLQVTTDRKRDDEEPAEVPVLQNQHPDSRMVEVAEEKNFDRGLVQQLINVIDGFTDKYREIAGEINYCSETDLEVDREYVQLEGNYYDTGRLKEALKKAIIRDEDKKADNNSVTLVVWSAAINTTLDAIKFLLYRSHPKGISYCDQVINTIIKHINEICESLRRMYDVLNDENLEEKKEKLKYDWTWDEYLKKAAVIARAIDDLGLRELAEIEKRTSPESILSESDDGVVSKQKHAESNVTKSNPLPQIELKNREPLEFDPLGSIVEILIQERITEIKAISEVIKKEQPKKIAEVKETGDLLSPSANEVLANQAGKLGDFLVYMKKVKTVLEKNAATSENKLKLVDDLVDWKPGFELELIHDDDSDEKQPMSLIIQAPFSCYIKQKSDSLSILHKSSFYDKYSLDIENVDPNSIQIKDECDIRTLELLMRQFENGAEQYPGIIHRIMTWPFMYRMPKPPRETINEQIKKIRANPICQYNLLKFIPRIFSTSKAMSFDWFDGTDESIKGLRRFTHLAQEAGNILFNNLMGTKGTASAVLLSPIYLSTWTYVIHTIRNTHVNNDGWDGLFDDDVDFCEDGYRDGLYTFRESHDIFLDSAFVCNTLIYGHGNGKKQVGAKVAVAGGQAEIDQEGTKRAEAESGQQTKETLQGALVKNGFTEFWSLYPFKEGKLFAMYASGADAKYGMTQKPDAEALAFVESTLKARLTLEGLRVFLQTRCNAQILDDWTWKEILLALQYHKPQGDEYTAIDCAKRSITIGTNTFLIKSGNQWDFIRLLITNQKQDKLTPRMEGATDYKNSVDALRRKLSPDGLKQIVIGDKDGYRLNPVATLLNFGQVGIRKTKQSVTKRR